MAIRVLLDFDVLEEHITLLSLLMAPPGVNAVAYAFPKVYFNRNPYDSICLAQVRIVTTCVDPQVDERFWILPGLGNFGDRSAKEDNRAVNKGTSIFAGIMAPSDYQLIALPRLYAPSIRTMMTTMTNERLSSQRMTVIVHLTKPWD